MNQDVFTYHTDGEVPREVKGIWKNSLLLGFGITEVKTIIVKSALTYGYNLSRIIINQLFQVA